MAVELDFDAVRDVFPRAGEFLLPDTEALREIPEPQAPGLPAPVATSLSALALLTESAPVDPAALDVVAFGDSAFWLIASGLPDLVWKEIGLDTHEHDPDATALVPAMERALAHLGATLPSGLRLLASFSPGFVVAAKRAGVVDDVLITSASVPAFPLTSFVSAKAPRHIPPNTVIDFDSDLFLAENMLHEGIHQLVNLAVLTRDYLPESYDSATSPTVRIAWRETQDLERNKNWELDRVLHATTVYLGLSRYRAAQEPAGAEAAPFAVAVRDGAQALDYLSSSLVEHREHFTAVGQALIGAMRADAVDALQRIG